MSASAKLLGEGSYGCVFYPMLDCDDGETLNKHIYQRMVSKVFTDVRLKETDSVFNTEADLARLVNKLDPNGKYFATPSKLCKVPIETVEKHPAIRECEELSFLISSKPKTFLLNQIVMPDYGLQLDTYLSTFKKLNQGIKYPANDWIFNIGNLLQGVKLLQQYKLVHMDIKHSNILFDNKTMRVIDFSLVKSYNDVYSEKYKNRLTYEYLPYPFDFPFVYYNHYKNEKDPDIFSYYKLNLLAFDSKTYELYLQFYDSNRFAAEQTLKKEAKRLQEWIQQTPNWFERMKEYANRIDIYSVGITCLFLHNELDFSKISKDQYVKYMQFLKKLTQIDFTQRPTIDTAISLHAKLIQSL